MSRNTVICHRPVGRGLLARNRNRTSTEIEIISRAKAPTKTNIDKVEKSKPQIQVCGRDEPTARVYTDKHGEQEICKLTEQATVSASAMRYFQ